MGIGTPQRSSRPLRRLSVGLAERRDKVFIITLSRNHTFVFEITFVAHQYNREVIAFLFALDSQDLPVQSMDLVERLLGVYREYEHKSLSIDHVLFPHCSILLLACGVEDVEEGKLVIDDALLSI